jgi:hypothetical protein
MTYEPEFAHSPGPDGLLPPAEREQLTRRLEQAVQNFVDSPRQAMEMADSAFNEATAQLTEAIAERGRALRSGWQDETAAGETEELRLLLRRYREATERLLHI